MPNFHLSDSEIEAIVAYLQKFDTSVSSATGQLHTPFLQRINTNSREF